MSKPINERLVEIRYKPDPRLLDYRGQLGASIISYMSLSEWQINTNRVDVFNKEQTERLFVSFRNAGAVYRTISTRDYFADQAVKYLRFLFNQKPFSEPFVVERLGVKLRIAIPVDIPFSTLLEQFRSKVVSFTADVQKAFNAKLIDVGAPINFSTSIGNINTLSGPMEKEQLKRFFDYEDEDTLPEVAFFNDIDYWIKPTQPMSAKDIIGLVKQYAQENEERHERLRALVLGE